MPSCNLRANPNATIARNGMSREVVARELSGSEREIGYQRGEEIFSGFTQYRRWAAHRQIPVLRLKPLS
jgi:F420H(2)-dependent quinone reductase